MIGEDGTGWERTARDVQSHEMDVGKDQHSLVCQKIVPRRMISKVRSEQDRIRNRVLRFSSCIIYFGYDTTTWTGCVFGQAWDGVLSAVSRVGSKLSCLCNDKISLELYFRHATDFMRTGFTSGLSQRMCLTGRN